MGERFEPWHVTGKTRVAAWRRVDAPPWLHHRVYVGQLADGRWWAETTAEPYGWIYPSEAGAYAAAERMRGEGVWEPTSPNPTQDDPQWVR